MKKFWQRCCKLIVLNQRSPRQKQPARGPKIIIKLKMGCAVPDCSFSSQPDCALIRFPENEALRERWQQAIEFGSGLKAQCTTSENDESGDLAICSWHFEDKSFSDYQEPCMFAASDGQLFEVCSCRICLQFYRRNEMVPKDGKLGRKTVSSLIKRILGLTLEDKDFLAHICEECLVKLDICVNWIQEARKVGKQFNELALAAENEKVTILESSDEIIDLCEDQDLCVDEFVATIRADQDSSKYVAFEVDLIPDPDPEEPKWQSSVEFVAVISDEPGLMDKSPRKRRRRLGAGRPRKGSEVVPKQDFKDILARKCYICNTLYSSSNDLIGHLSTHAASDDYQCVECDNKRFNKVISYNHHLSFHDLENRPMKCDLCKMGFTTLPSLKGHQNREHGTEHVLRKPKRRRIGKTYQCDSCGKTFRCCYQLREHDNFYHKKIFTAVCTVCSKPFPTKSLLQKHYIVHSGEKPYKCDWCGEAYKNSTCLDSHVLKHKSGRWKGNRKQ